MQNKINKILVQIFFVMIHMTYAISYYHKGNNDILWALWGFFNIISMFFAIGNAEQVNRLMNIDKKVKYMLYLLIDILILVALLILGFYISILDIISIHLLVIYFLGCLFLVVKALVFVPNRVNSKVSKKISFERIHEINTIPIDEDTDSIVSDKKNIIKASALSTVVLVIFLINFIFFSAFNKNVSILHSLFAICFIVLSIVINTIKLNFLGKSVRYIFWETGMLAFSIMIYSIFQLYIFQVTFNFPLMIASVLMLIPLLRTQTEIHGLMEKHFSEEEKL
ncbi:MAG: hypothetical protein KKH92_06520 [Firmicutes bacterium]|nr:hypothetical protein [Bacillota bacterium]